VIGGRRLDANAPPVEAHIPCCYPAGFQIVALFFPTEGCWEVTAKSGDSELQFVTQVKRQTQAARWTAGQSITRIGIDMSAASASWSSAWLAVRSLLWTILLPGFFAGYVPWRFFGLGRGRLEWLNPTSLLGLIGIGLGVVLLAACIVEFARSGRGTLSPVDPPRHLVIRGLYKYVRNPMYLSVTTIVLGEVLLTHSQALAFYWAIWFGGANLFVMGYEEPTLRRRFGRSYEEYTKQVGRWVPRFPFNNTHG